jgi:hypothetical protein
MTIALILLQVPNILIATPLGIALPSSPVEEEEGLDTQTRVQNKFTSFKGIHEGKQDDEEQ